MLPRVITSFAVMQSLRHVFGGEAFTIDALHPAAVHAVIYFVSFRRLSSLALAMEFAARSRSHTSEFCSRRPLNHIYLTLLRVGIQGIAVCPSSRPWGEDCLEVYRRHICQSTNREESLKNRAQSSWHWESL